MHHSEFNASSTKPRKAVNGSMPKGERLGCVRLAAHPIVIRRPFIKRRRSGISESMPILHMPQTGNGPIHVDP